MPLDEATVKEIIDLVDKERDREIEFLSEIIKTPSPTFHEREVAELLEVKFRELGYDRAFIDEVGNAIGVLKGGGGGRSFLYNGHMDTVPAGEMPDPYSAKVLDGDEFGVAGKVMWGRGTSDMKGALAAMVMAGSALMDLDIELKGDLIVTGTVLEEEPGNFGPPALIDLDGFRPDAALIGEATNLELAHGNRGVVRTRLTTYGKSCHVSVQERGINALYKMAKVIEEIRETNPELPAHPILGKCSWAICKLDVIPNVVNVVPDRCIAEVDTRNIPEFLPEEIVREQRKIIERLTEEDAEFRAEVDILRREDTSWKGYTKKTESYALPFYTDPEHWLVKVGLKSGKQVMGKEPKLKIWGFGTECFCFTERGIPTIGFAPGEERFTHSKNEVLSLNDYITAIKVYAVLAANICGTTQN